MLWCRHEIEQQLIVAVTAGPILLIGLAIMFWLRYTGKIRFRSGVPSFVDRGDRDGKPEGRV